MVSSYSCISVFITIFVLVVVFRQQKSHCTWTWCRPSSQSRPSLSRVVWSRAMMICSLTDDDMCGDVYKSSSFFCTSRLCCAMYRITCGNLVNGRRVNFNFKFIIQQTWGPERKQRKRKNRNREKITHKGQCQKRSELTKAQKIAWLHEPNEEYPAQSRLERMSPISSKHLMIFSTLSSISTERTKGHSKLSLEMGDDIVINPVIGCQGCRNRGSGS